MIITLTGDNSFGIDEELAKLRSKTGIASSSLGYINISGAETSIEEIKSELSGYSLFSDKRLIVLNEPSKIKGFDEYIQSAAADIPDSSAVVLIEPKLDKRKSYYKYLQANTEFKSLNKLSKPILIRWVGEYAKKLGGTITPADSALLVDRVGDDQLLLAQELSKLLLYSATINKDSILLLTEPTASSTIFELLDAAFSSNTKKALGIYNDQRLQKVEPEQILAMLSWQLNAVAICLTSAKLKDSEVLSKSRLSPYTLTKSKQISSRLLLSELKTLIKELSNLDVGYKSSNLDLDEALKNFITSLSYETATS